MPKINDMNWFDKIMMQSNSFFSNCQYYLVTYSLPIEICRTFMLK